MIVLCICIQEGEEEDEGEDEEPFFAMSFVIILLMAKTWCCDEFARQLQRRKY